MLNSLFIRLNPFQRSLVSALLGLVAYGGWAYLVNASHGSGVAFKAACVQGSYSFALTFVMTILIESFYSLACRLVASNRFAQIFTIIATCVIVFSGSWWVNAMAGTPEIFKTVILGYVVGGAYTAVYVIGLAAEKIHKQA